MNLKYVNVATGTYNDYRFSNGNVYPVTAYPNGLAFFSIQNHGDRHGWWHDPMANFMEGIRLTHQPSPWINDYGQLILMPQSGRLRVTSDERWTNFNLKKFKMTPTYMEGYLSQYEVLFKLAPTKSGALIELSYEKEDTKRFNLCGLNGETKFEVIDSQTLIGSTNAVNHGVEHEILEHFLVKTSHPFEAEIGDDYASLVFDHDFVTVGFITSFVSKEQALINYHRELANKSFQEVLASAEAVWNERLNKITLKTDDEELRQMFYTALYRANLFPRAFHEFDDNNNPIHFNPHLGKVLPGYYYVDNGFWDTFRTNYPFMSIVYPDLYQEVIRGYQNYFDENGWYPKWISPNEVSSMTGTLADVVMSEAVVKGVFNENEAKHVLNCLVHNATAPSTDYRFGRKVPELYEKLGYIPFNKYSYTTSETLDYSVSDYSISQVAKLVGDQEVYERFSKRSLMYKTLFDKEVGFLRSKDEDAKFRENWNQFDWGHDYIEGGAWQCAFATLHDFEGLNELYDNKLEDKLDELFTIKPTYNVSYYGREIHEMGEMAATGFGQCAISNQPSFHIPFIYSALGNVKKTNQVVKAMVKELFSPTVTGFPGDEDNGSMSCWYLFSVMGFYPINPASGKYVISGPVAEEVVIHLEEKDLVIKRDEIDLNHVNHEVSHFDLIKGGSFAKLIKK